MLIGAWASIIFIGNEKISLSGIAFDTTHNRMELQALIEAIAYLDDNNITELAIKVHSDSQYVVNLINRQQKLTSQNFITKKGTVIQNFDLVKILLNQINTHTIEFIKVAAHTKNGDVFNKEVDLIVRKLVREKVNGN